MKSGFSFLHVNRPFGRAAESSAIGGKGPDVFASDNWSGSNALKPAAPLLASVIANGTAEGKWDVRGLFG